MGNPCWSFMFPTMTVTDVNLKGLNHIGYLNERMSVFFFFFMI